ncbi:alpha/beta fold hydrolase [Paraburkholderia sp. Ac-20340]|uniref:alpha/beta hydrolase family protein n=1 Tax=Paraburkholderia sp. Ac-20340 TaxID=2703888 RepID=UPI00198190F2|nr:alpha/beta fold hydrolase [Paraburkholderia sp. Ac-20340]MBN3855811.1 alpha/beta fold hydrolase [Paraburkholderia sp. Ac-20340]
MTEHPPTPVRLHAADGFTPGGFVWRHGTRSLADGSPRPLAIVNAATSVRCRYYFRFAACLHRHGWDVLVYDYRGIGASRPARLADLDATWLDWGERDFEAALRYACEAFAGQPVDVVAHSIGGLVTGLAPSGGSIRRVVTVGAQYAYWRDYAPRSRLPMLLKWHAVMPLLTWMCGYFPAKRLGWMEDTPRGVALSWSRSRARFEETHARAPGARSALVKRLAAFPAPVLAISLSDDPFGTTPAIERLLAYFTRAPRTHLRIAPAQIGVDEIGHFAFFHSRFEETLWPLVVQWLRAEKLPGDAPGQVVSAIHIAKVIEPSALATE